MEKMDLRTPALLLDLNILKNNIGKFQKLCDDNSKEMWPMIKTHKSMEILKMQIDAGATGVLCGTLDEVEACCNMGVAKVMYAYPIACKENILRVIELSKKTDFILRLDGLDAAKLINELAIKNSVIINYTIIVDCGLHRFGVSLDNLLKFAKSLDEMKNLKLRGISTHPGHVYGASGSSEIARYTANECETLGAAKQMLTEAGYQLELVTSGSTPTFTEAVTSETLNILHPGNYVFFDAVQISLGAAREEDCSLRVYTTIISKPQDNLFICDAGAKCLGLDQGAHGNSSIVGFGKVIGHPELEVFALSEEVGKIKIKGSSNLKVGDKIEIIPNHSCSSANLFSYYTAIKDGKAIKSIPVDARGNSFKLV